MPLPVIDSLIASAGNRSCATEWALVPASVPVLPLVLVNDDAAERATSGAGRWKSLNDPRPPRNRRRDRGEQGSPPKR